MYGDVRASETQRHLGYLSALEMVAAFVLTTLVGSAAVPAVVLLWLSVVHVFGRSWAVPWMYSLLVGVAGAGACVVDHVLFVRMLKLRAGTAAGGASHG